MYIDVRIPYDPEGRLALAYNRALGIGKSQWILFLDHDVFLCNPLWYEMCLHAIAQLREDPKAACIGCECGGERHKRTMAETGEPISDIEHHIRESQRYYSEYGMTLTQEKLHVPGFFMLLNRNIAKLIGFRQVKPSINNIDQDFGDRLLLAGFHIYIMRGLYIYHRRGMKHLKKQFNHG